MKWSKRKKELERLLAHHGRDRSAARQFPDLSLPDKGAKVSNRVSGTVFPVLESKPKTNQTVSLLNKSSYQVIMRSEIKDIGK